ncbi:protein LURP-one-related 15-like [Typha angustifolia]|uniref:protein LURP-one-related 15-like n=1 Tax=Typha angustifolia TaxID=59011 RepID=UPI003C30573D
MATASSTSTTTPSNAPSAAGLKAAAVVVGSQFCLPHPVQLTVAKQNVSITDSDFAVTNVDGVVIFKVKRELLTLRGRCVLLDGVGNPVVTMKKKIRSIHHRWRVFRGDVKEEKDLLFSMKRASIIYLNAEYDVFLGANTSEESCDFKIKGNYLNRQCTVYLGSSNTILAQMSREYTVTNALLGKETFGVTVHPNVDYAFIVALVAVLDRIHRDKDDSNIS